MLTFRTLDGQTLQQGENEMPLLNDEKAFILKRLLELRLIKLKQQKKIL